MPQKNIAALMQEHRLLIIIIAVVLLLIELEIFVLAAMKSGHVSRLQVIDGQGSIIHETDGSNLSQFNKYYFEKTFGPLEQYRFRLITRDIPFPFRAWFTAAVGIPIGAILMFAFAVRAFQSLFGAPQTTTEAANVAATEYETRFEKVVATFSRFNIFTIGFLVLLAVLLYWAIPNFVIYAGRTSVETLTRYKWIFLTVAIVLLGLIIWVIYLKYLLAKRSIDSRAEIEKYRLQLELPAGRQPPLQLEYEGRDISGSSTDDALGQGPGDSRDDNS